MTFAFKDIPDLTGKVAIITGANTGIGKVSALEMARKGCHVILACRSEERAQPVVEQIKTETKNENVQFMKLDLSSLQSVAAFAEEFKSKNLPLNILMNNAGIMFGAFEQTQDGLEAQFGTNHVGHAYLTLLLLDKLEESQPSRIVNLSSMAHQHPYSEGIRFENWNDEKHYNEYWAYGQSKLCNVLFAKELTRRLGNKQIYVNAVHPGYVATDLQRRFEGKGFFSRLTGKFGHLFAISPDNGALTQLYVATHPDIEQKNLKGRYFVPYAKEATPSAYALNEEMAKKLWDLTADILKEKTGFVSNL